MPCAGGAKLPPATRAAVDDWLEFAESSLRSPLLDRNSGSGNDGKGSPALNTLVAALSKRDWLAGDAASAADALVGCLLLSCGDATSSGPKLRSYLEVSLARTATRRDAALSICIASPCVSGNARGRQQTPALELTQSGRLHPPPLLCVCTFRATYAFEHVCGRRYSHRK